MLPRTSGYTLHYTHTAHTLHTHTNISHLTRVGQVRAAARTLHAPARFCLAAAARTRYCALRMHHRAPHLHCRLRYAARPPSLPFTSRTAFIPAYAAHCALYTSSSPRRTATTAACHIARLPLPLPHCLPCALLCHTHRATYHRALHRAYLLPATCAAATCLLRAHRTARYACNTPRIPAPALPFLHHHTCLPDALPGFTRMPATLHIAFPTRRHTYPPPPTPTPPASFLALCYLPPPPLPYPIFLRLRAYHHARATYAL